MDVSEVLKLLDSSDTDETLNSDTQFPLIGHLFPDVIISNQTETCVDTPKSTTETNTNEVIYNATPISDEQLRHVDNNDINVEIISVSKESEIENLIKSYDNTNTVIILDDNFNLNKFSQDEINNNKAELDTQEQINENENGIQIIENGVYATIDSEASKQNDVSENFDLQGTNSSTNDDKNSDSDGETTETDTACDNDNTSDQRGRKRKKKIDEWKQNLRKRRRQAGKEYIHVKGKTVNKRKVKNDCGGKCRYQCSSLITKKERKTIFDFFWSLNDSQKNMYYSKTIEKLEKTRTRTKNQNSNRKFTFKYNFNIGSKQIRVCKAFYLKTLDVSGRRVQWFFQEKSHTGGIEDKRGRHVKKKYSEETIQRVRDHINSFPRMPSHYSRAKTQREYLESDLNLSKMYSLYKVKCDDTDTIPVKYSFYRQTFNIDFNIGFYQPKKDRCDTCEENKVRLKVRESQGAEVIDNDTEIKFTLHDKDKEETKIDSDIDRNSTKDVLCSDLQNVISCPRANVSNFFYKRKLNVFNLTAHLSSNKKAYNAIWAENIAGRGGNEIASALTSILENGILDFPNLTQLTLWSDSCVPQNRNSIMVTALKHFMLKHQSIEIIEQKFCCPGHSSIQEVDNIHSHIEKGLKLSEIYRPISLVRVLSKVRPHAMKIIQLRQEHFFNFQKASLCLKFSMVPFTKVKFIKLESSKPFHIFYKLSFSSTNFEQVSVRGHQGSRQLKSDSNLCFPVKVLVTKPQISNDKKKDLKSMFKYMPADDKKYYASVCRGVVDK